MDAAELNNYLGGTMGESCRHRSWVSSSLTLPEPPSPRHSKHRRQPPRFASSFSEERDSRTRFTVMLCLRTQTRGANTQTHQLALHRLGHVAKAGLLRHRLGTAASLKPRRHRRAPRGRGRSGGGTSGETRSLPA